MTRPIMCPYCHDEFRTIKDYTRHACKGQPDQPGPDELAPGAGPAPRDPLLVARQRTHGDFRSNAEISQRIKKIFRDNTVTVSPGTSNVHLEALDIIALKLSRILSGQADYADHWRDIAGYAKLAEEACK